MVISNLIMSSYVGIRRECCHAWLMFGTYRCIVLADLRGFGATAGSAPVALVAHRADLRVDWGTQAVRRQLNTRRNVDTSACLKYL